MNFAKSLLASMAIFAMLSGQSAAQHYVPTEPLNKNVLYEEFTGVKCPNCPDGHVVMAQILAANPGRAFAVAYHPFNSSYTLPYAGDPDFRRHYADSLYMTPWCGTSRYMPSAFVQRKLWSPPERLTERTNWAAYGNTIMAEPSPLNVGMATSYDSITKLLSVMVDVYYTGDVTGSHILMVTLAENDLQSQQSGATGLYTHKHTFRESLVGQWGDFLSDNAQAGTFYTRQFTFDNSTTNYLMENCELMAYVLDNANDEVVTGIGCSVGDTTYITPEITLSADTLFFDNGNQCVIGLSSVLRNNTSVPIDLTDVQNASMVPGQIMWMVDPWPFTTFPYTMAPGDSLSLTVHVAIPVTSTLTGYFLDSLYIHTTYGTKYLMIAVDQDVYAAIDDQRNLSGLTVLYNNYPNPCNTATTFEYILPGQSKVTLELLNLNGQQIRIIDTGVRESGKQVIAWDGMDAMGKAVPAGIYFYRLSTDQKVITKRLVVVR